MANQGDEQQKPQPGEVVQPAAADEAITEGDQQAGEGDESPDDAQERDTEGKLGDEEAVMPDNEPPKRPGKFKRFFAGYWHKKAWTLPLTLLLIIGVVFAVPATRYPLLAHVIKRSYLVTIVDSKTDTPVSGAKVTLGQQTATTDSKGDAILTAKVGKRTLTITKQYYKDFSESIFVGITMTHNSSNVQLQATGRQVPIKVVNKITGMPVSNAEVKVLDTEAKTDADGKATIVLPTSSPTQSATIVAGGYNQASATVEITSRVVSTNTFSITPSGRVYFLSNLSGNIDVVSTNLDGTGRNTVLAGTGEEDQNNTILLASTDWHYLALLSKRDGGQYAKLFLIDTSNNKVSTMDEGSATFTPVGWVGHYFVYQVKRADVQDWQPNQSALKSFNADTGKITALDQTSAQGSSSDYLSQAFGPNYETPDVYLTDKSVIYVKQWNGPYGANSYYGNLKLSGRQDQIISIAPDGSNQQILKNISTPSNGSSLDISAVVYKPGDIYFQAATYSNGASNVYYEYANGAVTQRDTITDDTFSKAQQNQTTYLVSPSDNQTFWSQQRDGKNTLFVGDYYGGSGNQIASLSDYQTYGWYTDKYLLVEKNGSELYIMPVAGGNALKISDYFKPPHNFYGYGGGYGGL